MNINMNMNININIISQLLTRGFTVCALVPSIHKNDINEILKIPNLPQKRVKMTPPLNYQ